MPSVSFRKEELKLLTDIVGKRWVDRVDGTRGGPECPKRIQIEENILLKLLRERSLID